MAQTKYTINTTSIIASLSGLGIDTDKHMNTHKVLTFPDRLVRCFVEDKSQRVQCADTPDEHSPRGGGDVLHEA